MFRLVSILSILGFLFSSQAMAAGDAAAGKAKSATCVACHGPAGVSTVPMYPNLAGQHATYIVSQLKAFKSGERKNASMSPMAKPLSEKDMEDLAAYYESLGKNSGGKKKRRR